MYSVQCTVYSVQCTVYSVKCTVYSVQCTAYNEQCTVYSVQCTVYSVQCTVYNWSKRSRGSPAPLEGQEVGCGPGKEGSWCLVDCEDCSPAPVGRAAAPSPLQGEVCGQGTLRKQGGQGGYGQEKGQE